MELTLVNLLGVATIAFFVPFVLGFFPRARVPAVALELVAGIIAGPAVLGWIEQGPVVSVMASVSCPSCAMPGTWTRTSDAS